MPTYNCHFLEKFIRRVLFDKINQLIFGLIFINLLLTPENVFAKAPKKEKRDQNTITKRFDVKTSEGTLYFEIHFGKSDRPLAYRTQEILEKSAPSIVEYFKHVPKNAVHILISDATEANGMATVFPRNLIVLNNYPPQGNQHLITIDDWLQGLVIHEFVHILHLDQTRGISKILTTIFGSIGKLGGVTPRWFTEGVAVWAETHFTEGGRLRNPLMLHQFEQSFLQRHACMEVDCLSNPNHYPYAQYPYWAGAFFLDALEKERPGVISCLVRENSKEFPGFLNLAFQRCTGNSATNLYKKFAENTYKKSEGKAVAGLRTGLPNYQKNHFVVNDYYVYVNNQRQRDRIIKESIRTKFKETIKIYEHIEEFIKPTSYTEKQHQLIFLGSDAPGGRGQIKVFKINLARDRKKEYKVYEVKLDKGYINFYENKKDHYYGFSYEDSQFILYEISNNLEEKELYRFPTLTHLHHFEFVEGERPAFYMVMTQNEKHYLVHLDIETKKVSEVFSSDKPIKQFGSFHNRTLIETNGERFIFDFSKDEPTLTKLRKEADFIVDMRGNENFCTYLSEKRRSPLLLSVEGTCESSVLKLASSRPQQLEARPYSFAGNEEEIKKANNEEYSGYHSLRHFVPHYWFLAYHATEKIDVWSLFTTLSDPKSIHSLAVGIDFYPKFSKSTPQLSYQLKTGPVFWTVDSTRSYTQNSLNGEIDTFKTQGITLSSFLPAGGFTLSPAIFYNKQSIQDFISDRDLNQYGLSFNLSRDRNHVDSFWQGFNWYFKAYRQKNQTGEAFYGGQTKMENKFRLRDKLGLTMLGTYGRLFKSDFTSGVIYGGGSVSYYPQAFHEFYGVEYTDVFGRRVSTARGQLEYTIYSPYSAGGGLMPLYLKDVRLLGGIDFINAERVFVADRVLRDAELQSTHFGVRLTADLMYLLPFELDIIYSKVLKYDQSQLLFLFRGTLFP
jgi:hypothetical protein